MKGMNLNFKNMINSKIGNNVDLFEEIDDKVRETVENLIEAYKGLKGEDKEKFLKALYAELDDLPVRIDQTMHPDPVSEPVSEKTEDSGKEKPEKSSTSEQPETPEQVVKEEPKPKADLSKPALTQPNKSTPHITLADFYLHRKTGKIISKEQFEKFGGAMSGLEPLKKFLIMLEKDSFADVSSVKGLDLSKTDVVYYLDAKAKNIFELEQSFSFAVDKRKSKEIISISAVVEDRGVSKTIPLWIKK